MAIVLKSPTLWQPKIHLPGQELWDVDSFQAFCLANPDQHAELDPHGDLILRPPSNAEADAQNTRFLFALELWNSKTSTPGMVFGPSAGFTITPDSVRSPDASFVTHAVWQALTPEQRASFPPLCPLFVMELRSSPGDSRHELEDKMVEYINAGAKLGWLIDPVEQSLTVYRPHTAPARVSQPSVVPAGDELPGFAFDFSVIFSG